MNTIHEKLRVLCKSDTKVYELFCTDYEENIDEIIIKTPVKETELCRGWVGDLCYSTGKCYEFRTGDNIEFSVEESYKDVLLRRIDIWTANCDEAIIWKYTFLKK